MEDDCTPPRTVVRVAAHGCLPRAQAPSSSSVQRAAQRLQEDRQTCLVNLRSQSPSADDSLAVQRTKRLIRPFITRLGGRFSIIHSCVDAARMFTEASVASRALTGGTDSSRGASKPLSKKIEPRARLPAAYLGQ